MCPGDTVVFTCVTDTGQLQWSNDDGDTKLYCLNTQICSNESAVNFNGIFVLKLINSSANRFESTATAHNVALSNDGLNITCVGSINDPDSFETKSIKIGWNNKYKLHYINFLAASLPSAPLNLSLVFSSFISTITINWVVPLDTPLCVHSYTVTISDSSLIMVYNTTDTSLNITDLTPGNEYSVTVAGRDGAGRLRENTSQVFNYSCKL